MGSHHNSDSLTKTILVPPTLLSSIPDTNASLKSPPPAPKVTSAIPKPVANGTMPSTTTPKEDTVKKEGDKTKPAPVRKKRGQYKKTILRQQAEAAAAAAAAGLPPPNFPPLAPNTSSSSSSTAAKVKAKAIEAKVEAKVETKVETKLEDKPAPTSTVESLDVRPVKASHEKTPNKMTALEKELAMLAEEAEEAENEKRKRDQETAERIAKRAQAVKHLRSLRSKIACAQIQLGKDLQFQSVDLFSDIFDEVLEDIGKDNSEMLNLLNNSHQDHLIQPKVEEDEYSASTNHLGHIPTRSSDKPKKRDVVPRIVHQHSKSHSSEFRHKTVLLDHEDDSYDDSDESPVAPFRRERRASQFIGQSWDVSSGRQVASTSSSKGHTSHAIARFIGRDDGATSQAFPSRRSTKPAVRTREELQLLQCQELEELQLRQRKEHEEFQRSQLEQLRELQTRQNKEFQEFEAEKARVYREHLDGLAEKRLKINQSHYSRHHDGTASRSSQRGPYSTSLSYEFDSGFRSPSPERALSQSRSPTPPPLPNPDRAGEPADHYSPHQSLSSKKSMALHRGTPASKGSHTNGKHRGHDSLPMSTMTMALTAMNEKKKLMKKALRRQRGHDDVYDKDQDSPDENHPTGSSGLLSPGHWSHKRIAPDDSIEMKRPSFGQSSSSHYTSQHQHRQHDYRSELDTTPHSQREISPVRHSHPQELPSTPGAKSRSRKRKQIPNSPHAITSPDLGQGFNKALLSHFDKWSPDTKTENFFDFVMSDPPDVDVDESEVEGLLENDGSSEYKSQDLNATPTSNAFKWYQEQQALAQELGEQPKMAPLQLGDYLRTHSLQSGATPHKSRINGGTVPTHSTLLDHHVRKTAVPTTSELIPGVDPLAMYMHPRKKTPNVQSSVSNFIPSSSPLLTSSPSMTMLYSEDGADTWSFNSFSIDPTDPTDPTDEYLHQESPMQSAEDDFDI